MLSVSLVANGRDLAGGILFAVLVNMKHLFLCLGPAYFVFLLQHHCIHPPRGYVLALFAHSLSANQGSQWQ